MDRERLREESVKGIDELLERPVLARFISSEQKRLLRAQRSFWQAADDPILDLLKTRYDAQPRLPDDEPTPLPEDE